MLVAAMVCLHNLFWILNFIFIVQICACMVFAYKIDFFKPPSLVRTLWIQNPGGSCKEPPWTGSLQYPQGLSRILK